MQIEHERERRASRIDGAAISIVILATCVGLGWLIVVVAATFSPVEASEHAVDFLAGIGQVLTGAIAVYLGAHWRMTRERRDNETPRRE